MPTCHATEFDAARKADKKELRSTFKLKFSPQQVLVLVLVSSFWFLLHISKAATKPTSILLH